MSDKKKNETENKVIKTEVFQEKNISAYAEGAYLEYAMSVVKGRAIPSVEDGLKPVHRRILYSMFKEGMTFNALHKKSARVVGNVLGLYHPHGDQSVYEALVRQAQDFSVRYPLVDGQGNFGSRDGDTAASMRYTEAKLSAITQLYMEEIKDNCVDFLLNYDGTELEPKFLPSRVPFILLNGNPGIGVGMATEVPCHNLTEVVSAVIACLENEKITIDEIMNYIKGPDFPTRGEIISSKAEIKKMYMEGKGSIRMRSKYKVETEGKNWKLVFYEIPYGVSAKKIMEEVDFIFNPEEKVKKDAKGKDKKISPDQLAKKTLFTTSINKFIDSSDKDNPIRLVFEPKSNKQNPDELAQLLLGYTSLECNVAANFTVVGRDGRPTQKSLMEIIYEWIDFRLETIERRIKYRLQKIAERLHILEGRSIILNHIDEVIELIKTSEKPKEDLIAKYGLSEIQAQDVLDLRLRQLGRLELDSINKEMSELTKEKTDLEKIISSEKTLKRQMVKELKHDMEKFGDERVTEIIESAQKVNLSALEQRSAKVVEEEITLAVSEKGWVKTFKGKKNDDEISFKEGDNLSYKFFCKNTDTLGIFDIEGKIYNYPLNEITKEGTPILTLAQISTKVSLVCPVNKDNKYLLAQDSGFGFIVNGENLLTRMKAGKEMVKIANDGKLLQPLSFGISEDMSEYRVAIITTENKVLIYKLSEISEIAKGKGITICGLSGDFKVKNLKIIKDMKIEFSAINKKGKEEIVKIEGDNLKALEKGRATKGSFLNIKDKTSDVFFKEEVIIE